ncbi:LPS translocon maturation chaperone LptM [Cellvibrio mixtus]|nr:lipoprotein [Cellvibrio mixtus]
MKSAVIFCAVAIMAGGIAACGQKGPLYLPQQQSKPQPDAAPAAKPASSAPASAPASTPVAPGTDPS